jgi:hypothetical protein
VLHKPKTQKASTLLKRSINILDREGNCSGTLVDGSSGEVCAAGAVALAAGVPKEELVGKAVFQPSHYLTDTSAVKKAFYLLKKNSRRLTSKTKISDLTLRNSKDINITYNVGYMSFNDRFSEEDVRQLFVNSYLEAVALERKGKL